LAFGGATPADVQTDATAVRARVVSALGGEVRLQAFSSLQASGTMEGVSGFPGTYTLAAAKPDRRLVSWDIGYIAETTGFAGNQGWKRTVSVRELSGSELERARRDAQFSRLYSLLASGAGFSVTEGSCAGKSVLVLSFEANGTKEVFSVDRSRYLPVCASRIDPYEEGPSEVTFTYGDYQKVAGLMLPYTLTESRPDGGLKIKISKYTVNGSVPAVNFENPERGHFGEPISLSIGTVPAHVYREDDGNYTVGPQRFWGMYYYQSASWSFDLAVREKYGRYLEPVRAHIDVYADGVVAESRTWEASALAALRRVPIARFSPQGEIYGFRHNFSMAQGLPVDHLVYTLEATDRGGQRYTATTTIPIEVYRPKTHLIFPMKGKFLVTSGHESYELEHKYERSQQFAIDIVALGENFELASNNGATMEDYVGFARRAILAPAAGRVVFARNDIPDGTVKADFLKMKNALEAIAGNVVIIDHGNGEFSVFCHMHFGSVRVKTGDTIEQGAVIGYLGAAGSPGLPHLHYQLQNGPGIFAADGLPLIFDNIERVGWLGRRGGDDERGVAEVEQPRSGVFMEAD
jgi:hypothetical protein